MIESYDMDAFRDSGTHWRYLQFALEAPDSADTLPEHWVSVLSRSFKPRSTATLGSFVRAVLITGSLSFLLLSLARVIPS